ncbi:MAG: DedA family protein [Proteobacteria bacterium]|nr:MAG: DedA family protein [Pseudomonadota bacterium]QKK12507.1 MAG: DedA family protein [Pseudomonadota bacterium]
MRIFSILYERVMRWSEHPYAPWYLGGLSFAESSFFPIPPDVMLAPMALAKPDRALSYALLTTLASVAGGIVGYLIGILAFDAIAPWVRELGYWQKYELAQSWFAEWGFWAILLAGFSPIPYKIFTITAGAISMSFAPFVVASIIGRGARFFLVAMLMRWGGERMRNLLRDYIDRVGWVLLLFAVIVYVVVETT